MCNKSWPCPDTKRMFCSACTISNCSNYIKCEITDLESKVIYEWLGVLQMTFANGLLQLRGDKRVMLQFMPKITLAKINRKSWFICMQYWYGDMYCDCFVIRICLQTVCGINSCLTSLDLAEQKRETIGPFVDVLLNAFVISVLSWCIALLIQTLFIQSVINMSETRAKLFASDSTH